LGGGLQHPVFGQAVSFAARLQQASAPGRILISTETSKLVSGRTTLKPVRLAEVKGFGDGIEAWEVVAGMPPAGQRELPGSSPSMCGRQSERARLALSWRMMRLGVVSRVLIRGEPGVGKSFLLQWMAAHCRADGAQVVWFECNALQAGSPLYPVRNLVDQLLKVPGDDSSNTDSGKALRDALQASGMGLDAVPSIVDQADSGLSVATTSPTWRTDGIALFKRVLSELAPVCVLVEDLHWADPASLSLLSGVMDSLSNEEVQFVFASRNEAPDSLGLLPEEVLLLDKLSREDSCDVVRNAFGATDVPETVMEAITQRADGVPLALFELANYLSESKSIEISQGRVSVVGRLPVDEIPLTLQDQLGARIDSVGANAKILAIASVLGSPFDISLLNRVAQEASLTQREVRESLVKYVKQGILISVERQGRSAYRFSHSLLEQTAYQRTLLVDREEWHGQVATALGARARPPPQLVAFHWFRAGQAELASQWWETAARAMANRFFHDESIHHISSALSCLEVFDDLALRQATELRLRLLQGEQIIAARGWADDGVGSTYGRALSLARSLSQTSDEFEADFGLFNFHLIRGDVPAAQTTANALIRSSTERDNDNDRIRAERAGGACMLHAGNFARATAYLDSAIRREANRTESSREDRIYDGLVVSHSLASWAAWYSGDRVRCEQHVTSLLAAIERTDRPFSHAYAHGLLASLYHCRCHYDLAIEHAAKSAEFADKHGMLFWAARANVVRGAAHAASSGRRESDGLIRSGIEHYVGLGAEQLLPYAYTLLAQLKLQNGEAPAALQASEAAVEKANKRQLMMFASESYRVKGEAHAALGDANEAVATFWEAERIARDQRAPVLRIRALASLVRTNQSDSLETAQPMLRQCLAEQADWLGDPDWKAADALLRTS
ncbi:MAG: tetratricopeptide (TPR) repeat protein, partial [Gammaproteobacteria bacterium]